LPCKQTDSILYSQQKQAELRRRNPHTIHGRESIFINIYFSPLFIQANLGDI
jgi:hypothetical protein